LGATELAGLKIFLRAANRAADGSQHAGNCAACHSAPHFSDFRFHNTGVAQEEYGVTVGRINLAAPTLLVEESFRPRGNDPARPVPDPVIR
jgi:cytochrome c peroxidase